MSVRRNSRILLVFALFAGCDGHDAADATGTPSPAVRVSPEPGSPCDDEDKTVCSEAGAARLCRDGIWARIDCSQICQEHEPPQVDLGCLITGEEERCLCSDPT